MYVHIDQLALRRCSSTSPHNSLQVLARRASTRVGHTREAAPCARARKREFVLCL